MRLGVWCLLLLLLLLQLLQHKRLRHGLFSCHGVGWLVGGCPDGLLLLVADSWSRLQSCRFQS